jgi:hypothetical protein
MAISEAGRQKLREQIHITKPWLKSTGAKTERGKAVVSQNALKTGLYSIQEPIRLLARLEREKKEMEKVVAIVKKMQEAYSSSNAEPHPSWKELFDHVDEDDFLRKLRNFKP